MEDSKSLDHHDEIQDKNIYKETLELKNNKTELIENTNNELNQNKNSKVNINENNIHNEKSKILVDNKNKELTTKLNDNSDKSNNKKESIKNELIREKTSEDTKSSSEDSNLDSATSKSAKNFDMIDNEKKLEENKKTGLNANSNTNKDKNDTKEIPTTIPVKAKVKPVKEPPIEKKPFLEFVNDYLIPEIKNEFKSKGKEVHKIILQKTHRPIAEDICWVIYCEITDTCNFWLSFEKDDITSLKSFSLCKNYEKPSIIESFLIDEKKITLKLIISRILQRLNGQKLIGAN